MQETYIQRKVTFIEVTVNDAVGQLLASHKYVMEATGYPNLPAQGDSWTVTILGNEYQTRVNSVEVKSVFPIPTGDQDDTLVTRLIITATKI